MLYVGLCNGAGWVVNLDSEQYVLLGIEKIIELDWCDTKAMYGLIYHELGHIYQMQHGVLTREYKGSDSFLWQLFTEGIAMYFEQRLMADDNFFHQNVNGWMNWCDANIYRIKVDFNNDLANICHEAIKGILEIGSIIMESQMWDITLVQDSSNG
jgi:hypothetical protein